MPVLQIFKAFSIDCAHSLPNVPENHKCRNVHGHTYLIKIFVEDELHPELAWVMDFTDIKAAFEPIKETLDHQYLNDIPGLENPTAENLAIWIWQALLAKLPNLTEIWVYETPTSGCVYKGQ